MTRKKKNPWKATLRLAARTKAEAIRQRAEFVVIIEAPGGPALMVDEKEVPMRFATYVDAREAAVGAIWEHSVVWWIVPLRADGIVKYGPDVRVPVVPKEFRS